MNLTCTCAGVITPSLPSRPSQVRQRENYALYNTEREATLRQPEDGFYKRFAGECSRVQTTLDVFAFNSQYMDLASLATIAHYNSGQVGLLLLPCLPACLCSAVPRRPHPTCPCPPRALPSPAPSTVYSHPRVQSIACLSGPHLTCSPHPSTPRPTPAGVLLPRLQRCPRRPQAARGAVPQPGTAHRLGGRHAHPLLQGHQDQPLPRPLLQPQHRPAGAAHMQPGHGLRGAAAARGGGRVGWSWCVCLACVLEDRRGQCAAVPSVLLLLLLSEEARL